MQIISTINSFVQLQGISFYKKKNILSCKITGKLNKHFPGLSRTYKQNSRTFQDSKKKSRTFQDVATLVDTYGIYILVWLKKHQKPSHFKQLKLYIVSTIG